MAGFRTSVERWLEGAGAEWRLRPLAAELAADMADLGVSALGQPIPFVLTPRTDGFTLGVQYVLEGSALGARLLCKQVEALGLHSEYGARHLWAQAASLEPWRAFLALLRQRAASEFDDIAAGANATFSAAAAAMQKAAHG